MNESLNHYRGPLEGIFGLDWDMGALEGFVHQGWVSRS
jgi:hypothetical protein